LSIFGAIILNFLDFINTELSSIKLEGDHDRPEETIAVISNAFNNRQVDTKYINYYNSLF
jgi:hypothetical protein